MLLSNQHKPQNYESEFEIKYLKGKASNLHVCEAGTMKCEKMTKTIINLVANSFSVNRQTDQSIKHLSCTCLFCRVVLFMTGHRSYKFFFYFVRKNRNQLKLSDNRSAIFPSETEWMRKWREKKRLEQSSLQVPQTCIVLE